MNWCWHHFLNALESVLLVAAMLLLMAAIGWLFGGVETLYGMLVGGFIFLLIAPRLTPPVLLRMMDAQALTPEQGPRLFAMVRKLASRSGLAHFPHLYRLPTPVLNAFSTGIGKNVSITISDGLLRALDDRELAGVLAQPMKARRYRRQKLQRGGITSRVSACRSVAPPSLCVTVYALPCIFKAL